MGEYLKKSNRRYNIDLLKKSENQSLINEIKNYIKSNDFYQTKEQLNKLLENIASELANLFEKSKAEISPAKNF